jgi:Concanavalin A-like lectin/glucanases superfamily
MSFGFGFSFPQLFGSSGAAPPVSTDASFPYVSLLTPGNGTNAAQNNTFLDSSTNNFTITRNGTATQGTFTPFSQTGWGGYFGTKTDTLSIPSVPAVANFTGDFTIEAWVYPTDTTLINGWGLVDARQAGATAGSWVFNLVTYTSSGWLLSFFYNATNHPGSLRVLPNQWTHVAVVRSGSTISFFVNGALDPTTITSSGTFTGGTSTVVIGTKDGGVAGYGTVGYVSNLRMVNGTAVYTTAFTPPTAPLTAITNTTLLTLQSNYFKDNSTTASPITPSGTTSIQAFSPFLPTAAYSAATNGGAAYLNGSTDSLSAPANAAFSFTGDFTIEAWVYFTTVTGDLDIVSNYVTNVASDWTIVKALGSTIQWYPSSAATFINSGITPIAGAWYHIAAVRSGTTCSLYVNGVSGGTPLTFSGTLGDAVKVVRVGSRTSTNFFPGYISGARIVKGTAVYTANFTPPTAPLTAITNTSLLLSGTNAGIIDNSAKNTAVTTIGNAQISTAQSQWGGGSMLFDGTGDWVTVLDGPVLRFGTGDFTVEGWVYKTTTGTAVSLVSKGAAATGWTLGVSATNFLTAGYTATTLTGTVTTLSANTWYYFALVRSGTATGNIKLYINGTLEASSATAITTDFNQTDVLYIGASRTATTPLTGYIDDLRITNAARTVTTTPTAAFPLF